MNALLPFIVAGIATGAIYAVASAGLTITYKTSGLLNIAYGAIIAGSAYLFYWMTAEHQVPWGAAFAVVLVVGLVLGFVFETVARLLVRRNVVSQVTAFVGVVVLVQAVTTLTFGPDPLSLPQYLPHGTETFRVLGVNVAWAQVTIAAFAAVVALALFVLFRYTSRGLQMRAVVDSPELLSLHGVNPVSVRRYAWVLASLLSAASGMLVAPLVGVNSSALTYLAIGAMAAAALGAFKSIPLSLIGGFVLGVLTNVAQKYVLGHQALGSLPGSLPFILLLAILLVTRRRRLVPAASAAATVRTVRRTSIRTQSAVTVVVIVVLAIVPFADPTRLLYYSQGLTTAMLLLSVGLLARNSGQVSLCQAAFAGVGAIAFSRYAVDAGIPWLLAMVLAGLTVIPFAAVAAVPAIRLSGVFVAVGTLAFGIVLETLIFPQSFAFTQLGSGRAMPRPSWAEDDQPYYFLLLAFFVVFALLSLVLIRARFGRMLQAVAEIPRAVSTLGLGVTTVKLTVFCIAGVIAGFAGALYGVTINFGTYSDVTFTSFNSLLLVAILALAPIPMPWCALFAIPAAVIPGYLGGENSQSWLNVLFGVFAIVVGLQGEHTTPAWLVRRRAAAAAKKAQPTGDDVEPVPTGIERDPAPERPAVEAGVRGLRLIDLRMRFGGLLALDGVSVDAPAGRVTGLIGPNGAGKTTAFNVASGLLRAQEGSVLLHGREITSLSPHARAVRGVGRTFQLTELCESLTVAENVALGREAGLAGNKPNRQLFASASANRQVRDAVAESLRLCGIERLADVSAAELTTGERRLVEVARCLAGDFDVLLLDEPCAGLDRYETERLGRVLRAVAAERGCAILLVEHDMTLVMEICEHIYVLDFGKQLFDGTAAQLARSEAVKKAYLGSEHEIDGPVAADPVFGGAR